MTDALDYCPHCDAIHRPSQQHKPWDDDGEELIA